MPVRSYGRTGANASAGSGRRGWNGFMSNESYVPKHRRLQEPDETEPGPEGRREQIGHGTDYDTPREDSEAAADSRGTEWIDNLGRSQAAAAADVTAEVTEAAGIDGHHAA